MKAIHVASAGGLILLSLAGCVLPEYLRLDYLQTSNAAKSERVVCASLETVTQATQLGMRGLGLKVEATPVGQDVRLVAGNSVGDQLIVVFSRIHDEKGESTRVRIEAGDGEPLQILIQVLSRYEVQSKA